MTEILSPKRRVTWGWAAAMTPEERRRYIGPPSTRPKATKPERPAKRASTPTPVPVPDVNVPPLPERYVVRAPRVVEMVFDYIRRPVVLDDCDRLVTITPYDGAHGLAGYVITIAGTPPRAVLLVLGSENWVRLSDAHVCVAFPSLRHRVEWLDQYTGSRRQRELRTAILHLLVEQGIERRAA